MAGGVQISGRRLIDPRSGQAITDLDLPVLSSLAGERAGSTLEGVGSLADQTVSTDYRDLWLAYIRDAGTAGGVSGRRCLGGDFLDAFLISGTSALWVGADWWAGGEPSVDGDDTFTGSLIPFRNGQVSEAPIGTLTDQVFTGGGAGGDWLDAQADGGLPAPTFWWVTSGVRIPPYTTPAVVVAHRMGSDDPTSPSLGAVDTSLITLNAFGLYSSHVDTGWGPEANFWLHKLRHDSDDALVYGMAIVVGEGTATTKIEFERIVPGEYKIGRVPDDEITTPSSWEFWTGTGWSDDVARAAAVTDSYGNTQMAMTGSPVKIGTDHWVNVGRSTVLDPYLDVWRASAPQGPWEKIARVLVPVQSQGAAGTSRYGGQILPGEHWVSHHATILPHLSGIVAADQQVAMLTSTVIGHSGDFPDMPIGAFAPSFVVVPTV